MSHGTCKTVRIKVPTSTDNPAGIVVINEEDFDKETMKLDTEKVKDEPMPKEASHPANSENAAPWLIKS